MHRLRLAVALALHPEARATAAWAKDDGSNCRGKPQAHVPPSDATQREAAAVSRPDGAPRTSLPLEALGFRGQNYGFTRWADLFSSRQLLALTTFSDLVIEAREHVLADALAQDAPRRAP